MWVWNKCNLRQKFLFISLATTMGVLLVTLCVSMVTTYRLSTREAMQNSRAKTDLIAKALDDVIGNAKYNIKAFSTYSSLQNALVEKYEKDDYAIWRFSSSIQSSVNNIMDIDKLISDGYVESSDHWRYHLKSHEVTFEAEDDVYRTAVDSVGRILISTKPKGDGGKGFVINFTKSLIDINNGKSLGVLSFDLDEKQVISTFQDSVKDDESVFLVAGGSVIAGIDNLHLGEEAILAHHDASEPEKIGSCFLFSQPLETGDATLLFLVSRSTILRQVWQGMVLILFLSLFLVVAAIIVTERFSHSITDPIVKLTLHAEQISKGILEPIKDIPQTNDEIGKLTDCLNTMIANIQQMSAEVFSKQNEKREYELALLQAQINPHFLYNCFDNIDTLISENNQRDASNMLHQVENYYRHVLSSGRNIITLAEEMDLNRAYLEIQQIRHLGSFSYTISLPDSLRQYKCLKMLVQPLVENSVIHGFAALPRAGMIQISVEDGGDEIAITVMDNGCGISSAELSSLQSRKEGDAPHHYGLLNIQERLSLSFGEGYPLRINTVAGEGTVITVRFPKSI